MRSDAFHIEICCVSMRPTSWLRAVRPPRLHASSSCVSSANQRASRENGRPGPPRTASATQATASSSTALQLKADEVSQSKTGRDRTGDRTAEHAGPPERHVYSRKRRRHYRSPARQRRRTRRRGGPVRGQVQTLLHARPCGHHRRAGRGTLLKRSPPSEKPV